jgi:TonB-linked SusC/RagA family outer membrane protein
MKKKLKLVFTPGSSRFYYLLLYFICLSVFSYGQTVTGTVSADNGKKLLGVTVAVKGISAATSTDDNGKYTITAGSTAVLVFSSVGYLTKEISVSGRNNIDLVLAVGVSDLSEIVVTALGIKKDSRKLGYATSTVNPELLSTNRTTNVGNSLEGRVAGLNVSPPAGGPGGSSKIRIRGQSSFGANNSPLIIVNGIPINNTAISGGTSSGSNGNGNVTGGSSDQGDGLQSINPDDIETMTVLKGAPAAALYGSRAKDGVIIITTKTGRGISGIGVELSSTTQLENALDYTDFQYQYGQGEFGVRPVTIADAQSSGVHSFGVKFDGQPTMQFDGVMRPYLPYKNRIRDFYNTGLTFTNTVALSGGTDKGSFRLSYSNTNANTIMPNSAYHKKIVNLGLNYNFTPKLSLQLNANYSNEHNRNPPQIGIQDMNANTTVYTMATSIDVNWLKNHIDANGNELGISRFTNRNNPYWITFERFENMNRDRLFGNASLKYQFTDWLYIQSRFGQDYFTRPYNYNRPTGTRSIAAVSSGFNGYYYQDVTTYRERNLDFLIGLNKTFGNFGIDITAGGNQLKQISSTISTAVNNFYVRGLYTIPNGQTKAPNYVYSERRVNSLYGAAEFSFRNFLYVNVTARNDWFSTLNPKSNNYMYPSVTASFVFSQAFAMPSWLNYGKLRGGYAEVGGDTDPYSSNLYYSVNANTLNGIAIGSIATNTSPNPDLKPLKVKEAEVGLELRLFNSRLTLDVAAYRKNTVDEILNVDISGASGFNQTKVNIGKLRNEGIEWLVNVDIIKGKNFMWQSGINGSYNKSEVIELANGQLRFDVGTGEFFGIVSHEVGKPLASLRGFDYKRNAKGEILTAGGKPIQGDLVTFGSAIPKLIGGWLNTLEFKGIRLTTLFDFKSGHKILSNSNLNFLRHGLSKTSLVGREGGVLFPGVENSGNPNAIKVEAEDFYSSYRSTNMAAPFVYKGDFIRWRTLSVGYDLSRFVKLKYIKGVAVSLTGYNLLLIKKYTDNLDPEAQLSASDFLQGIESHALPTTRTFGFNVNVKL